MKRLYDNYPQIKYGLAFGVIIATIAVTPYLRHLAYLQRGYHAFGGEFAPLVLSIVIARMIVLYFNNLKFHADTLDDESKETQ